MTVYDKVVEIPVGDVKPYPGNPRINGKTIDALVKAIKRIGFNVPIVVDSDMVIIKGHSRHAAAQRLGMATIPCIISSCTAEQAAQDRITDNRLSELATWDPEMLRIELGDIELEIPEIGMGIHEMDFSVQDVEIKDVEKVKARIDDEFQNAGTYRQLVNLTCPGCGEAFLIDANEVARFAAAGKAQGRRNELRDYDAEDGSDHPVLEKPSR